MFLGHSEEQNNDGTGTKTILVPHFSFLQYLGTLVKLPLSMKQFDFIGSGVIIDVAAVEWPANATALFYHTDKSGSGYSNELVCRTTDPDESKEGAEMSEIRIKCTPDQVIGMSPSFGGRRGGMTII